MNNALILLGTSRRHGNTMDAVEAVLSGRDVEIIDLARQDISYFDYDHGNQNDDFLQIAGRMAATEILIFATPVYWYSMSGPLKVFIDRWTDLLEVRKDLGRSLSGKRCYLIASGTDETLPPGFEAVFARTAAYFEMSFEGCLYCSVRKDGPMSRETRAAAKKFGDSIFR